MRYIMRQEVLDILKRKIEEVEKVAKPNEIETGMTGSFLMWEYNLKTHHYMTDDEFNDGVYDEWLRVEHARVFENVNGEPL